jgi:hypothetical protein
MGQDSYRCCLCYKALPLFSPIPELCGFPSTFQGVQHCLPAIVTIIKWKIVTLVITGCHSNDQVCLAATFQVFSNGYLCKGWTLFPDVFLRLCRKTPIGVLLGFGSPDSLQTRSPNNTVHSENSYFVDCRPSLVVVLVLSVRILPLSTQQIAAYGCAIPG